MHPTMDPTSYGDPLVHGDMNKVFIGKYCSIANSVMFDGGLQHNTHFVTTYPLWKIGVAENKKGMSRGDIHVGSDVWIGDGAMIMSGVTIGDGAVIGARTVVTRDVLPYTTVVGAPMQWTGTRFSSEQVTRLLKIQWWNWPEEKIRAFGPLMLSENIELFLEKAETDGKDR